MIKYFVILVVAVVAQGCEVDINEDLKDPQPLLLKPSADISYGTAEYYQPDNSGVIYVATGNVINFNCPGGTVLVDGTDTGSSAVEGACKGAGKIFTMVGHGDVSFDKITCNKHAVHIARYTGASCLTNFKQAEIGFEVADGRFIREIEICFDDVEQHTRYSKYTLSHFIGGYQVGYPRPSSFLEGSGFYNLGSLKLDDLYTRNTQRIVINTLVGLPVASTKYVSATDDYYLARGHLTAKADFVYGSQHRLTFYFINAAPQWQTFNGGNWQSLEDSLQKYAAKRPNDLEVYTGSYGKASLPHESTGELVELVLFKDMNGQVGIPVPAIYWKVIYDPVSKQGLALVGVNNPYQEVTAKICKDVCSQVTFLTWKPTDIKSGFSYCCAVDDLRKVVKDVPALDVTSLLT